MASPDKTPYLDDGDFRLYNGEALETLKTLPAGSVHCVVTSPPYWGLRDYGTASWEGGNPDCDHAAPKTGGSVKGAGLVGTANRDVCGKCGALRVDQALGLESTPELYVARMVEVFREVRRVLRGDGVCWVNLGDSYNGAGSNTRTPEEWAAYKESYDSKGHVVPDSWGQRGVKSATRALGLKPKDLVGIPWRVAFALQQDGWYLRSDVIWAKPNPMPESVTDRPTKAHEYVFLLTRSPRYFFDQEAVREPHSPGSATHPVSQYAGAVNGSMHHAREPLTDRGDARRFLDKERSYNPSGRNVRSVWEIATQPYREAHFATYPEELVRRCILAGTSERGCCPECGAPWEREVEQNLVATRGTVRDGGTVPHKPENPRNDEMDRGSTWGHTGGVYGCYETKTMGWRPSCGHDLSPVPCTVLDPFGGSGTTALVARKHGRRSILIELSAEYCELAARRLSQLSLLSGDPVG